MTSPRRTFAIISHPDAGKTTLTEKLLHVGGAIHLAGEVKARGQTRRARSDWMKIEQQRGISVTSSVMTFEKDGVTFNLLDTPGHEDFSEDTYRTLTAVDSAVMVIDAARGIEAQTRKLFEVCRLRSVPIITFVNKVDREGRGMFELLDEIADVLQLDVCPMSWPIGMGSDFQGVLDLATNRVSRPEGDSRTFQGKVEADPALPDVVAEEIELAQAGYAPFDADAYRNGDLTPVYFGSALKDFGPAELIAALADFAPSPRPQPAEPAAVSPDQPDVTGFVFKVQANMDPNHRDRIAFMRLCSGTFRRGMKLTPSGSGKPISVHSPILFFAQNREVADEAFPGDIIGIPNHGALRVGDTLAEKPGVRFTGPAQFRARDPAPRSAEGSHQDQAAPQGAGRHGRGRGDAGLLPGDRPPTGSSASSASSSWRCCSAGWTPNTRSPPGWSPPRSTPRAGSRRRTRPTSRRSPTTTARRWPRTATARRCSWAKSAWDVGYMQDRYPKVRFAATKER